MGKGDGRMILGVKFAHLGRLEEWDGMGRGIR